MRTECFLGVSRNKIKLKETNLVDKPIWIKLFDYPFLKTDSQRTKINHVSEFLKKLICNIKNTYKVLARYCNYKKRYIINFYVKNK